MTIHLSRPGRVAAATPGWPRALRWLALFALASAGLAQAQTWPTKTVRVIVPFAPGATTDLVARLVARKLADNTGQPFVVDSRLGAGGTIGAQEVARAPADGYTLLVTTASTHAVAPAMGTRLPYNTATDFTPLAHLADSPLIMMASPTINARNLKEFIALARQKPGQLNYSSSGVGTLGHLTTEAFKAQAGVFITHIPYKGSAQAIPDLMTGTIHLAWDSIGTGLAPAKDGRVRGLAVSGPRRSPLAPDIPTMAESGLPGFSVVFWFGLYGPANMPAPLVRRINEEVNKALQSPDMVARFTELGIEPGRGTAPEFGTMVAADLAKWSRVVTNLKLKAE